MRNMWVKRQQAKAREGKRRNSRAGKAWKYK